MLAWFYQGFINNWLHKEVIHWHFDDWLNEEVIHWHVWGLPVCIRTSCTDFTLMAWGFACPHQGFSHQLHINGTGVFNLTALNTKTVQQPCELTVSLTQLVAFLNCCTLSSQLPTFQVTQNTCSSSLLGSCINLLEPLFILTAPTRVLLR